jgi:hypothetical protein
MAIGVPDTKQYFVRFLKKLKRISSERVLWVLVRMVLLR